MFGTEDKMHSLTLTMREFLLGSKCWGTKEDCQNHKTEINEGCALKKIGQKQSKTK